MADLFGFRFLLLIEKGTVEDAEPLRAEIRQVRRDLHPLDENKRFRLPHEQFLLFQAFPNAMRCLFTKIRRPQSGQLGTPLVPPKLPRSSILPFFQKNGWTVGTIDVNNRRYQTSRRTP